MVQTTRTRRSSTANRETVELCVIGPKTIVPKSVTVETYLSNTWLNFFNKDLKLNVPLNEGIFICNNHYCPSAPKEGVGWRCDLNEPISNYVNRFERHCKKYTVRICRPSDYKYGRGSSSAVVESRTPRTRSSTPGPNGRRTRSTPGNQVQRRRSVANARSPSPQHRQPSILIPTTSTSGSTVVTPRSQQSRYPTRQKRLHDPSNQQLDTSTSTPEIPAKRQRKQIIVPRLAEPVPGPSPAIVKQEMSQAEDDVPQINDVRSVLKIELPSASSAIEEFYAEDDELETDVSSAEGESGSDVNGVEGTEEQGHLNESENQGQQQENSGRGDFSRMSDDTSEEDEEAAWARNDGDEEGEEEVDDEDDGMSMCTAVTEEEIQLRREGIQVEDIKSVANGRMTNFSNAYMLRMRNEIKTLKKNNHWVKNVEKSPLACYFLQELFKE